MDKYFTNTHSLLNRIEEIAGIGIWIQEIKNNSLWWSAQTYRIFGMEPHSRKMNFNDFLEMVIPEYREQICGKTQQSLISDKTPYNIDYEIIKKDNTHRFVHEDAIIERDDNGNPTRLIGIIQDITERKEAEQALKESERNFKLLFEKSPLGIYTANPDGMILEVNQTALNMLGSPSAEATKQINVLTFPPLIEKGYSDALLKCIKTKKTVTIEIFYKSKWGKEVYLYNFIIPLKDNTGKVTKIYTVMDDITERKKALQALEESQSRFKALSEATYEAIFISDNGICIEANESASKMFGYTHDELIGIFGTDVIAPESKELVKNNMLSGYEKPYDAIAQRKDGTKFHAEFLGRMFKYKGKNVRITAVRDITERKKAESHIKKLSSVVTQSPAVIVITDLKGKIEYVNRKFSELTGYTPEEAIGQNPRILKSGLHSQAFFKDLWQTISSGKDWRGEFYNKKKNGEFYWEAAYVFPIFDNQGNIINYIKESEDITKQKEIEQNLKENEARLKKINQTKDKFFSIIAHDLRSPFNSLLGLTELLHEDFDHFSTHEQKEIIQSIHKEIKNTYKLLENLLLWSRSQKGTIKFKPERLNLYEVAQESFELLKNNAQHKFITFTNQIPRDIYVEADKEMQSTIIRNLFSNAIKFTSKGGTITIKARSIITKNNQEFIEVSVIDNGVGISKEIQSKLFGVGETISTRGTENENGTGLGLSLCKEFVEKHDGKIWVESKIGNGTSFYFTIPTATI